MTDLEFVARCTEKDAACWDEFLHKYSGLIYNYIHSVLKIKGKDIPSDTLSDLYQEIILSLIKDDYKKLKTFRAKNGCSLASWLRAVTVNFTLDYLRRLKPETSLDQDSEQGLSLKDILSDDSHLKLEERIVKEERQRQLSECIERLSIDDKYFLDFYLNNKALSLDKLESLLGLSKPAIDMRKSRLIQRLKNCFEKKGFLLDF